MSEVEGMATASSPLTVIVTWRVKKGCERDFESWRREIAAAALKYPGHMGVDVILPHGATAEYVVVFRFDTYDHLRAWQESNTRRDLLKKAEPFREGPPSYRLENGLEFWFRHPDLPARPPVWKMAAVTALGVWPVSMLVPLLLGSLIRGLPAYLQSLLVAIGIVIILTWVVMPVLTKILAFWLTPSKEEK